MIKTKLEENVGLNSQKGNISGGWTWLGFTVKCDEQHEA